MKVKARKWQLTLPPFSSIHGVYLLRPSTYATMLAQIPVMTLFESRGKNRLPSGEVQSGDPSIYAISQEGVLYIDPPPAVDCNIKIIYAPPLVEI